MGRPVELVIRDDRADAGRAAEVYRRLVADDGVHLLLGNYSSGLARETIPVVEEARTPCVFPMAWQPGLWRSPHQWAVPTLPLATEVTRPLVEYLRQQGVRRVAVVHASNNYAADLAKGLRQWLDEYGLTTTTTQTYGDGQNLDQAVGNGVRSKPDALAGGNVGDAVPELARAARQAAPKLAHHAWFELDEPVILLDREVVEGMAGFGLWLPTMPYAGNRDFVRRFSQRWESEYPETPIAMLLDHHAAAGYAAGQVLGAAVVQAGAPERGAVRDALFGLDTATVFGRYKLDARGIQVGKTVPVVGYRHGLRDVLWPHELAG